MTGTLECGAFVVFMVLAFLHVRHKWHMLHCHVSTLTQQVEELKRSLICRHCQFPVRAGDWHSDDGCVVQQGNVSVRVERDLVEN